MILVKSICVMPNEKNVRVGEWDYDVNVTIYPQNATNCCVTWTSSNPEIVSVNPNNGYIYGRNPGTAVVFATATDGSGVQGFTIVNVACQVPVEYVVVCPENKTIKKGETFYPSATVYPKNATNKSVFWDSSNPEAVMVDRYSGQVQAVRAGWARIIATTEDGEYSDSVFVLVEKDTATILRDGAFSKVEFNSMGETKTWLCVNYDVINSYGVPSSYISRASSNLNAYIDGTRVFKTYSPEEIRLLYAIDPYGVIYYVHKYAEFAFLHEEADEETKDRALEFKDKIFLDIFGREPKYFYRISVDNWREANTPEERSKSYSESEFLFGMRVIWDGVSIAALLCEIIDYLDVDDVFKQFAKGTIMYFLDREALYQQNFDLVDYFKDKIIDNAMDRFLPEWLSTLVQIRDSIDSVAQVLLDEADCYKRMIDCYNNDVAYNVFIELNNGDICQVQSIADAMEQL